ncbi:carboxypeptidase-like regulatory domain-containing protein [Paludisphaera sp.]|uniref:carboxypeptidase-like regulatory domain-containing protein n=1 Tax=Paludisphaera sp. TaxID=2017432 RepID=UPI00301D6C4C
MAGSTGARVLWGAIVAPPLLLLGVAGAVVYWPERTVGVMDAARRAWSGEPSYEIRPFIPVHRTPAPQPVPTAILRGIARAADGRPLRDGFTLAVIPKRKRDRFGRGNAGGEGYTASLKTEPEFETTITPDPVFLMIAADGHAPKVVGPYPKGWPPEDDPVEVVLEPGVPFEVRVVDDQGSPILGAEVAARLIVDGRPVKLPNPARTDDEGRAYFANLAEADHEFEPNVHGFLFPDEAVPAEVVPGGSITIPLERGPLAGFVEDERGRPVANAVLLVAGERDGRLNMAAVHPRDRVVLARSGPDGRFTLPALHDESEYLIRAEGPDGSLGFAQGARRADGEVEVILRSRRMARGDMPRRAATSTPPPRLRVNYSVLTGFTTPGYGGGDPWRRIQFDRSVEVGPDGRFEFPVWETVDAALLMEGRAIRIPWPPDEEPIRIDTAAVAPAERTIRFRFQADETLAPFQGTMTLRLMNPPPELSHLGVTRTVKIVGGMAALPCLSNESFRYESTAIPGFWTGPARITGGSPDGDHSAIVRVYSAGSIGGRVLEADGSPAGAGIRVVAPLDPEWVRDALRLRDDAPPDYPVETAEEATTDAEGRFLIPAFPLNVATRLVAGRGRYASPGEEIRLSSLDPHREVEFLLPPRASASARVVDPEGRPIAGARLEVALRDRGAEWRRWPAGETDADGRATIDDLAEGEANYSLVATFADDYRPIVAPLEPGGPPLELRAERGSVLEGRVVEAVTGWPIPDLTLHAEAVDTPDAMGDVAEARTDADGRFRLTTLPEGPIRLDDRLGLRWVSPRSPIVRAGAGEPVVIRVIDLRDTDPRPRPVPEP